MNEKLNNIKNSITSGIGATVNFTRNSVSKTKIGVKKIGSFTKKFVITLAIVFMAIGGFATVQLFSGMITPQANAKEPEPIVITETFVEGELKTIGKLNTTDYNYALDKEINEPLKLFDKIEVPGTTKSLKVKFTGVVKACYMIEELHFATVGDTVIFSIPSKPHIENYLTGQTAMIEEDVWLNPIESTDYQILADGVMTSGLTNAEADGIYEQAEQDIKEFLTAHFEELGYKVKFTTSYI